MKSFASVQFDLNIDLEKFMQFRISKDFYSSIFKSGDPIDDTPQEQLDALSIQSHQLTGWFHIGKNSSMVYDMTSLRFQTRQISSTSPMQQP